MKGREIVKNTGKNQYDGRTIRRNNTRIFGVVAAVFCLIGFFIMSYRESTPVEPAREEASTEYVISMVSDQNGPESGTVLYRKYKTNPALFHIVNKTNADTCIRCCDGLLNRAVIQFYVRAQEEATIEVPVGYFELHLAMGKTWRNQEELFGEETVFFSDSSKYGQEFGRKKTCEFVIEPDLSNLVTMPKDRY